MCQQLCILYWTSAGSSWEGHKSLLQGSQVGLFYLQLLAGRILRNSSGTLDCFIQSLLLIKSVEVIRTLFSVKIPKQANKSEQKCSKVLDYCFNYHQHEELRTYLLPQSTVVEKSFRTSHAFVKNCIKNHS